MGHYLVHLYCRHTWHRYGFDYISNLASYLFQDLCTTAVNIALTFCMGQDLDGLMAGSLGQPMAQIFLNSFGQNGTLVMWSFIILAQYMMGSSTVCFRSRPPIVDREQFLTNSADIL